MGGFLKALVALEIGLNFSARKNEPILGGIVRVMSLVIRELDRIGQTP